MFDVLETSIPLFDPFLQLSPIATFANLTLAWAGAHFMSEARGVIRIALYIVVKSSKAVKDMSAFERLRSSLRVFVERDVNISLKKSINIISWVGVRNLLNSACYDAHS